MRRGWPATALGSAHRDRRLPGPARDFEPDGQPSITSSGADAAGVADDEVGVVFRKALIAGKKGRVDVTASAVGMLDAWIDFNNDGDWSDPGEQVFASQALLAGLNVLKPIVPADALANESAVARFRFSSAGGLAPTGLARDGEVEDHVVAVRGLDFGDAPAPYPTLRANNGARHVLVPNGPYLGTCGDPERDGQPSAAADADDNGPTHSHSVCRRLR
jgi:hypothetical protein